MPFRRGAGFWKTVMAMTLEDAWRRESYPWTTSFIRHSVAMGRRML